MSNGATFKSGPQVLLNRGQIYPVEATGKAGKAGKARLTSFKLASDREFDRMLRQPTIKLASKVVTAMLLAQPWVIESEDEDIANFVYKQIETYRTLLVRSAVRGMLKSGWRAFELAYETVDDAPIVGGVKNMLVGVKALRNVLTDVLIWEDNGDFAGVEVRDTNGGLVEVDSDHTILVNADEEYFGGLGEPGLRDAQETSRKWDRCDTGAQRYDDKVAGGFLAVGYPMGKFDVEVDGTIVKKDGAVIAKAFAEQIKASGYGLYPRRPDPETGEYKDGDWKFDHVMAGGAGLQPNFIARLKYLDALLLRVFGLPERSLTEGSFGTKAEAEAHGAMAFLANLERAEFIVHGVNQGFVKTTNRANFGDENACSLKLGEMSTEDKALYSSIFIALLKDPNFSVKTITKVDVEELMDKLDIPALSAEEQKAVEAELEAKKAEAQAQAADLAAAQAGAAETKVVPPK